MRVTHRFSFSRHLPVVTLACLSLAACYTTRAVQPSQITESKPLARVWVTRTDSSTAVLDMPIVSGDTLNGLVMGEPELIPLSETSVIRTRASAPAKTAGVALLASAAALGFFFFMESRPDVGNAQVCLVNLGARPMPFGNCCSADDTIPC